MAKIGSIEDTTILPPTYEEFARQFSGTYSRMALLMNHQAEVETLEVELTTTPKVIASYTGISERTALILVIGSASGLPSKCSVYASFGLMYNKMFDIANHVPSGQTVILDVQGNNVLASLNSGKGMFRIKVMNL